MSTVFDAEAIIRAAASGDFPAPGEVLFRIQDRWVFQQLNFEVIEGELDGAAAIESLPFSKVTGVAIRGQLPSEIAYEDEVNIFLLTNSFRDQVRRGIRTITAIDSPYAWASTDWHLNVDTIAGPVTVTVPDASLYSDGTETDQLHFKHIGRRRSEVRLRPAIVGQKIDGCSEAIIRSPMRSFTLVSDSSGWWIQ